MNIHIDPSYISPCSDLFSTSTDKEKNSFISQFQVRIKAVNQDMIEIYFCKIINIIIN